MHFVPLITCAALALAACSQATSAQDVPPDQRLFGQQEFTIVYRARMPSAPSGEITITEYVRNWGQQRAKVSVADDGGRLREVFEAGRAYRFHPQTGQIFWLDDHATAAAASSMAEHPERTFGHNRAALIFNGQPTSEAATLAGHECTFFQGPMPNGGYARACYTDWGGLLYLNVEGPFEITQVADEVRIGNGGPDSAFEFDREDAQYIPPGSTTLPQ